MLNGMPMPHISQRSKRAIFALLILAPSLLLAACASDPNRFGDGASVPPSRDLPPTPAAEFKAPPAPALDTQCRFPWYGVAGCKGKDTRAMLRLTKTYALELKKRLGAAGGWYDSVRRDYGAK
jgi:hypothetical protein